ncbi:MAG TPA: FUSC family protein [Solirubrobacteraceae bacterium]|jgi:uncharacterized membrane protein YccC|nr:FUSC family protein [Solirubrobacteraceae bacterium]
MDWLSGHVSRLRKADPGFLGLKTATRAAICIPAVFAFTHQVIGNAQMSLFGAFGSFAILVFADFGGTPRARLSAFLVLAAVGAIFIPLGTLCAKNPWLAGASMGVVAFAVLFSGLINGYFAAGATAAMLTYILPVSMPVSASVIPDRLAGWGIACLVGISAQLLIWPTRPRDRLGPLIARACRELADATESGGSVDEASKAIGQLRDQFFATPYRPTGPTDSAQALTFIVDELDWFKTRLLAPTAEPEVAPLCRDENGEVIDATAAALRAAGARFEGSEVVPDLARLDAARDALAESIPERLPEMPQAAEPDAILGALGPSFRLRVMSYSAHQIATNAMAATGGHRPRTRPTLEAVGRLAREHTGPRSQWFRDSIRGAAALAIGVFVARETGVQNGFWVVLGTLSVLRSNALATGATVISALAGTAIGIVAGALIVVAIGTDTTVLWLLLPVAVLFASYAPRIVSFAAGQAGFTILLLILFNLIVPVGWKVGIVRVQDVAIGFGISLAVGVVFWPRGAASLVRSSVAAAYVSGVEFVDAAVARIVDRTKMTASQPAARAAEATAVRLDDAFRHYLAERSAKRLDLGDVGTLVSGAGHLRRTALSLTGLGLRVDGALVPDDDGERLSSDAEGVHQWYCRLATALVDGDDPPPVGAPNATGRRHLAMRVGRAAAGGSHEEIHGAVMLLWASEHLDNLAHLEERLVPPAAAAAEGRRRWWARDVATHSQ